MATKTISLELDAYDKLKKEKMPGESFSAVVRRAHFGSPRGLTGREILEIGPLGFSEEALNAMEEAINNDSPPDDPWNS